MGSHKGSSATRWRINAISGRRTSLRFPAPLIVTQFTRRHLDKQAITPYDTTYYVVLTKMSEPTLLILASLADGDKHGYAIMEDISAFAEISLGPGTLYGAITRLEERGWIRAVGSHERRQPYRLTASGQKYLEDQLESLERVIRTATRRLRHA